MVNSPSDVVTTARYFARGSMQPTGAEENIFAVVGGSPGDGHAGATATTGGTVVGGSVVEAAAVASAASWMEVADATAVGATMSSVVGASLATENALATPKPRMPITAPAASRPPMPLRSPSTSRLPLFTGSTLLVDPGASVASCPVASGRRRVPLWLLRRVPDGNPCLQRRRTRAAW